MVQLKELLTGPTALTFVRGDAALAAKALADTARATQVLEFKGGVMNGAAISAADVQAIARLPSRDVLYGQLVGMVASPLSGLARTLNAFVGGLATALGQIRDQGLVGGEVPAPAPAAEERPPERAEQTDDAPASPPPAPAEQTVDNPDSPPPEPSPTTDSPEGESAVPGPNQAEGEDPTTDTAEPHAAVPAPEEDN